MSRRIRALTVFGEDLDALLKQAGKFTLREYADECGVSYKYILQLRTIPERRPGRLYVDLLKPFTRLRILNLNDSHRLSLRHRGKPLSFTECRDLFPDLIEQELVESVKRAGKLRDQKDVPFPVTEPIGGGASTELSQPQKQQKLYRRVFVGRQTELNKLQSAFDTALSSHGSLVMVVGEPGIGKTALCGQLANYVDGCGGKILVGHCYEPGSLTLPYNAFIEVLTSHVLACDTRELKGELGIGDSDIARIVPEITEKLEVIARPRENPDEERYRLLKSVADFLGKIAEKQPVLVILEDLHNADQGTLEMLEYIARYLSGMRLLIVGTYRDIEINRVHPLSNALAELRRLPYFERVFLRGLDGAEVNLMLSGIIGHDAPAGLGEAVFRQTEGNPLFAEEVTYYLLEEGVIVGVGEARQPEQYVAELKIPNGLYDVLGKRLSALSRDSNTVLSVAAVIGREFRMDVLQTVVGLSEDDVMASIEEAQRAAILEESPHVGPAVAYRFTHALFRQALYEEIIAPRRNRLHQKIARSLEKQYEKRLEDHATELAEHFSQSTDPADLKKAVDYSEMAAKRAIDVFAYGEAVRLLEQALQVQKVLDPDDKSKQYDLLLALSEARYIAGEPRRALEVELVEALTIAESLGDESITSRVCTSAIIALVYLGVQSMGIPLATQWAETAAKHAKPDTIAKAWADFGLAWTTIMSVVEFGTFLKKEEIERVLLLLRQSDQALEFAKIHNDIEAIWFMTYYRLILSAPQHRAVRWRLAEELANESRFGVPVKAISGALLVLSNVFMESGQRERVEKLVAELKELAERTGQANTVIVALEWEAFLAVLDGNFDVFVKCIKEIPELGEELGIPEYARMVEMQMGPVYLLLGEDTEIRRLLGNLTFNLPPMKSLYLATLGQKSEAVDIIKQWVVNRMGFGTESDEIRTIVDVVFLEASILAEYREAIEMLFSKYREDESKLLSALGVWCLPQTLGKAALCLGKNDEARDYFSKAIDVCIKTRFRPGLAVCRLNLAELLLDHYLEDKKEALEHLDFAINEFQEMKMKPYLERALKRKDILKA